MQSVKPRPPGTIVQGLWRLCHPLPVCLHTLAVTLFALLAAWPRFNWRVIMLVILAHSAMQLAIAVLNDYCDRHADALGKRNKPIPRGLILPREALLFGLGWIIVMFLLLLPLNPLALLISLLYLALGMGYNLGLKATPLSGVVFALAIPLIPIYAFVGVGHILPFLFWLIPVAALLGVALNLANSLPDIEEDAAGNVRTLAVVLGTRGTLLACPLLILAATGLIALLMLTHTVAGRYWIAQPTLLVAGVLVGVLLCARGWEQARKRYFYVVVVTCLLLAGGWLVSMLV